MLKAPAEAADVSCKGIGSRKDSESPRKRIVPDVARTPEEQRQHGRVVYADDCFLNSFLYPVKPYTITILMIVGRINAGRHLHRQACFRVQSMAPYMVPAAPGHYAVVRRKALVRHAAVYAYLVNVVGVAIIHYSASVLHYAHACFCHKLHDAAVEAVVAEQGVQQAWQGRVVYSALGVRHI